MFSGKRTEFRTDRERNWYRCSIKMKKFLTECRERFGSITVEFTFKGDSHAEEEGSTKDKE